MMDATWTDFNRAHVQPFDVNAVCPLTDDWALYNAAHADPRAVPIESIQASPAGHIAATASASMGDGVDLGDGEGLAPSAAASVTWQDSGAAPSTDKLDVNTLTQYEAVAPGLALALLQAEQAQAKQRRTYRLLRLVVTTVIAITAIACGQWALVHGADQQALYLSGAGLISLLTTVLQHD